MDPIKKLMDEHRVIESVLAALPAFSTSLDESADTAREDLAGFVTFIREFADAYHHGKEEDMLFTAMVESGMPREGGPVAVMLAEHEQGRAYVATLLKVVEGDGPLTESEISEIRSAAGGYADLLRDHIMKEDQILYPMALKVVPAERLESMATQFTEYEARESAAAEVLALKAAELVSKFTD
jgi:hemerythrin-like domain-containing protein